LLPNATSATATNAALGGDGTNLQLNTIGASGSFQFFNAGTTSLAKIATISSNFDGLWLGHGAAFNTSTNFALYGDAVSSTVVNAPSGGALFFDVANVSVMQLTTGTQAGVALGANLATAGHMRVPNGFVWDGRDAANSVDARVLAWDSSNNLTFGDGANVSLTSLLGFTTRIGAATDSDLDQTTLHIRNSSSTEFITVTPQAAALIQFNATNATSGQISWTGPASGAGATTSIIGNAAGGAGGDGGNLVVGGGSHAAANNVDGSFKINNSPFNGGFLSFTPVNGAQTFSNPQSDANFVVLNAGATNPVTINWIRRIADTSCVWVKNNTSQTVTVAYLTGGTVTIAGATSALICSDGANLQKVMNGT